MQHYLGIVDLDRQSICNVVAEGGHSAVVVGPAPFAEHVGKPVDEDFDVVFAAVVKEPVFSGFFARAVGVVQGGLNGGGEHDGGFVVGLF